MYHSLDIRVEGSRAEVTAFVAKNERRGSVVVSTSALTYRLSVVRLLDQACFIIRCKNLALNIRDCLSLCISEETLKAVDPFYLVPMPG